MKFHASPDCYVALACYRTFVKGLIADHGRYGHDCLQDLMKQNQDMQMSRIEADAEGSPDSVVAWELRRILAGCPICEGDFRSHAYFKLASVVINEKVDGERSLAQFLHCMRDCRWREVLGFRHWIASADTIVAFAFRCDKGRVGIVAVLNPADSEAPDEPLHFTILSVEEGKNLLGVVKPGQWIQLRPALHLVHQSRRSFVRRSHGTNAMRLSMEE